MNDSAPPPGTAARPARSRARARPGSHLRYAELLLNVSRQIAAIDSLDEVLQSLVAMTTAALGAERGSLFLNDPDSNELYSRVAQGAVQREIRFLNTSGIAGYVYSTGQAEIVDDAYQDARFNRTVDEQTGFVTRSILCVPIRTVKGELIGVAQALNKKKGSFTRADLEMFQAMMEQAAVALQSAQFIERMKAIRKQELEFLDVVSEMTADIKLGSLLQKVMGEATRMLSAERSTLFLNDEKTGELWSEVAQGLETMQIRLPNSVGIAGAVFTSGRSINIPHAYADLRFNPAFDRKTGFFTRSILCVPVVNKQGRVIGVTQVLNKRGGPFTDEDEARLKAFTAQVSIALENAKLFAEVQNMKNYSDSVLQSMANGVITLDEEGRVATCNAAALRMFRLSEEQVYRRAAGEFFAGNDWLTERLRQVEEARRPEVTVDAELVAGEQRYSVNVTVLPLISTERKRLGSMIMIENITNEKRLKTTMARYMDPSVADQMVAAGSEILGGRAVMATVLFADIRGFTGLTESLGAQGTVSVLNEYFTIMVECIQREGGMLDKFIGDAIMAGFGIPVKHDDDEDRALRAAIAMITQLAEWNARRAAEGKPLIQIGVGLNTDTVVAGNIGSPKRMDFTMIGDGVNLASRLEGACKEYAARILVSENTYRRLKGTYRAREIDLVRVKGKTQPVAVYEILDYHTEETYPNLMDALGVFRDGLRRYRERRWDDAASAFAEVLSLNPEDRLAQIYVERCAHLKASPPPADWSGVWVMATK